MTLRSQSSERRCRAPPSRAAPLAGGRRRGEGGGQAERHAALRLAEGPSRSRCDVAIPLRPRSHWLRRTGRSVAAERGYVGALGPLLGTCGPGREGGRGVLRAFRGEPSSEPGGVAAKSEGGEERRENCRANGTDLLRRAAGAGASGGGGSGAGCPSCASPLPWGEAPQCHGAPGGGRERGEVQQRACEGLRGAGKAVIETRAGGGRMLSDGIGKARRARGLKRAAGRNGLCRPIRRLRGSRSREVTRVWKTEPNRRCHCSPLRCARRADASIWEGRLGLEMAPWSDLTFWRSARPATRRPNGDPVRRAGAAVWQSERQRCPSGFGPCRPKGQKSRG